MKRILNFSALFAIAALSLFVGGCKDDESIKWVDLRYRVEDSYTLQATNADPIEMLVSSTDPWVVYSDNSAWTTITPDNGVGTPVLSENVYDVTVTYADNPTLDDREDVLTIKSDYWIGKQVSVLQRGLAESYFQFDEDGLEDKDDEGNSLPSITFEESAATGSFSITSNQNWSAAVTEGNSWLTIDSQSSFTANPNDYSDFSTAAGTISYSLAENKSASRVGVITIYNRLGDVHFDYTVNQGGIVLEIPATEYRVDYKEQSFTIDVESNMEWSATVDDDSWVELDMTSDVLTVKASQNYAQGTSVRSTTVTLITAEKVGYDRVSVSFTLKQSATPNPTITYFEPDEEANWYVYVGSLPQFGYNGTAALFESASAAMRMQKSYQPFGKYEFYYSELVNDGTIAGETNMTLETSTLNITLVLNAGKLNLTGSGGLAVTLIDWTTGDVTKPTQYKFGISAEEGDRGYLNFYVYLNDELLYSITESGYMTDIANTEGEFRYVTTGIRWGAMYSVCEYWSYEEPIDWGN
ncbi:MAG: BACON domain-containing carbohydrate-binding protein [Rikenellaceae bacterium]